MSSDIYSEPYLSNTVRYSRQEQRQGAEWIETKVEIYASADAIRDDNIYSQLQEEGPLTQNHSLLQKGHFRHAAIGLTVVVFLMLASITVLLIWVAMKDGHHDLKYNQLNQNSSRLQTNNSGKCCPDRWMRWRGSCYFKSTKKESWADSRTKCKRRGADLVIIDSREEQEFVSELTINEESWIGLMTTGYEWKWVDGSNLTTMFWEEGAGNYSDHDNVAVCCNKDGQWTQSELNEKKGWICEKHP